MHFAASQWLSDGFGIWMQRQRVIERVKLFLILLDIDPPSLPDLS